MGVGGIILRTRLCVDESESFWQFVCFNSFYCQRCIQIIQEYGLNHVHLCEIQDGGYNGCYIADNVKFW